MILIKKSIIGSKFKVSEWPVLLKEWLVPQIRWQSQMVESMDIAFLLMIILLVSDTSYWLHSLNHIHGAPRFWRREEPLDLAFSLKQYYIKIVFFFFTKKYLKNKPLNFHRHRSPDPSRTSLTFLEWLSALYWNSL